MCHVRKKFLGHIFVLFVSLRGRINFLNMARYGSYSEKTSRTHFEEPFDFFTFNTHSIEQTCSPHRIIAGDCSFAPKSGKHTPHRGKFWNGCVSKALPGLEISSLAVVDIEANTAFHLECKQTPGNFPDEESRIDFYVNQVIARASELKELADYFVYDGAAGKGNRLALFLPRVRQIRVQTKAGLIDIPQVNGSLLMLGFKCVKFLSFLGIFLGVRFSLDVSTHSSPRHPKTVEKTRARSCTHGEVQMVMDELPNFEKSSRKLARPGSNLRMV